MKKGLSANQLKLIAILAMVVDHTAWGFVEMFSVQGQIMHVIGRLTIPIMCFFVAEGYKKTSSVKGYIERMATFAAISIIPFYLFFGHEYGYRQNFIFDLLLALLSLAVMEKKDLAKPLRYAGLACLIIISALIGGWPIYPILLVLVFYYGKSFKQKAAFVSLFTVLTIGSTVVLIKLNEVYNFAPAYADWRWYQWMYFLGFVLALPLLKLYNGKKGEYPFKKRHFFFAFYPGHFMILFMLQLLVRGEIQLFYIGLHIVAFLLMILFSFRLLSCKPSKAVTSVMVLSLAGIMYMAGFLLEIAYNNFDIAYAGVVMQYIGEVLVYYGFVIFIGEFGGEEIPHFVQALIADVGLFIIFLVATDNSRHWFYTKRYVVTDGPFPRIGYEHAWGFYVFVAYSAAVCLYVLWVCVKLMRTGDALTKKRGEYMLIGTMCPWLVYLICLTGITGGYEVSCLGVFGSIYFIQSVVMKYGFFDSVQLAAENAIDAYGEGVMVTDGKYKILYYNSSMEQIIGDLKVGSNASKVPLLAGLISGSDTQITSNERIFEVKRTELMQEGYITGYMLTTKDMTEHLLTLDTAERAAHTDYLTGLYNRFYFEELYLKHRKNGGTGTLIMIDLDNFKAVNDKLGHDNGDMLITITADVIKHVAGTYNFGCRLGGDEFMVYIKDVVNREKVKEICESLQSTYNRMVDEARLAVKSTMSIGATIEFAANPKADSNDFIEMYKRADDSMYNAKAAGKATYYID